MTENPQKSAKPQAQLHDLDHHSIYSNHLNNSSAKMQYSLSKTPRWKESPQKQQQSFKFYDIPSIQSNRSTSFGYGNKVDFNNKHRITPPPNSYHIQSQFQQRRSNGIAIGLGRQLVRNVSLFDNTKPRAPGPGTYQVKQRIGNKISLSGRLVDLTENWIRKVPGPGAYQTLELINKNLKSSISKFQNPKGAKFGKTQQRSDFDKYIKKKGVPGPGQYSTLQKQYQVASKFAQKKGLSFSRIERPSIANISIAPGPGAYNDYSQFIRQ